MNTLHLNTGFVIAIAWPQTYCKEAGSWYEPVTRWLGISRNNYYRAGHAALVLVDGKNRTCKYFDFGRYHAPYKHGRVRSAETDHDLKINTHPQISDDGKAILNINEILDELQGNNACHGDGTLYASYSPIDYDASLTKAMRMQSDSPIPYGPFKSGGSNCSRFVNTVILSGKPAWYRRMRLKYFIPFTPTPLNNVKSLSEQMVIPVLQNTKPFFPDHPLSKSELNTTIPQPVRHPLIPAYAKWISGEGVGSWFAFFFEKELLKATRYSPDGIIECSGLYKGPAEGMEGFEDSIDLDYLSNCKEINLLYKGKRLTFYKTNSRAEDKLFDAEITTQIYPEPIPIM
jgi:hypothetical protein